MTLVFSNFLRFETKPCQKKLTQTSFGFQTSQVHVATAAAAVVAVAAAIAMAGVVAAAFLLLLHSLRIRSWSWSNVSRCKSSVCLYVCSQLRGRELRNTVKILGGFGVWRRGRCPPPKKKEEKQGPLRHSQKIFDRYGTVKKKNTAPARPIFLKKVCPCRNGRNLTLEKLLGCAVTVNFFGRAITVKI